MLNKKRKHTLNRTVGALLSLAASLWLVACGTSCGTTATIDFSRPTWSLDITSSSAEGARVTTVDSNGKISYSENYHYDDFEESSWSAVLSSADWARLNEAMSAADLLNQEDDIEVDPDCADGGSTTFEFQTTIFGSNTFRIGGGCGVNTIDSESLAAFLRVLGEIGRSYAP